MCWCRSIKLYCCSVCCRLLTYGHLTWTRLFVWTTDAIWRFSLLSFLLNFLLWPLFEYSNLETVVLVIANKKKQKTSLCTEPCLVCLIGLTMCLCLIWEFMTHQKFTQINLLNYESRSLRSKPCKSLSMCCMRDHKGRTFSYVLGGTVLKHFSEIVSFYYPWTCMINI